jgi:Redoxin
MRVLRTSLVMAAALGIAPGLAVAQYTAQGLLTKNAPVFRGVDHDLPASLVKGDDPAIKAAVDACKIEVNKKGFTVRDGQGKLLRRFVDTNGQETQRGDEKVPGTHLDQWSYYQDGFEVYRESDTNEDGSLDEVRWMNSAGSRIAKVKPSEKGGVRVVAWTRLSAEEASKVLVLAIVYNDRALLESVLATPEELESIGAPKVTLERAAEAAANRNKALTDLLGSLKATGWTGQTAWSRFDGAMPHVIPSDPEIGLKNEVMMYENVIVWAEGANQAANAKMSYLSAPEVVKIGDAWKFIDLPHAVDPAKPAGGSLISLRTEIFAPGGIKDPVQSRAQIDLAAHDAKPPANDAGKKEVAEWHVTRVKILQRIIAENKEPADKLPYQKQAVNDLAEAIRTDLYPEGLGVLDKLIASGGKIGSYAQYRKVLVEFDIEADQPGANLLEVQKASLAKYEQFLTAFPKSDEEPEALLALGTVNDFNGNEKEARQWYARLAKDYPASEAGKKATGAVRRLDIDGKPLKLAGTGLSGKPVSVDGYRGTPVLVVYWTTTDVKDLRDLATLKDKLGAKGFEVLGVNLDADKAAADAAAKELPQGWATIHEPGGMDGRLANELGIISTPTMILLDAKGQVVNRKIRKAGEVEKALDKALAGKGVGMIK